MAITKSEITSLKLRVLYICEYYLHIFFNITTDCTSLLEYFNIKISNFLDKTKLLPATNISKGQKVL